MLLQISAYGTVFHQDSSYGTGGCIVLSARNKYQIKNIRLTKNHCDLLLYALSDIFVLIACPNCLC